MYGDKKNNMKKSDLIKFLLSIGFAQADAERLAGNTPDDGVSAIDAAASELLTTSFKDNQKKIYENDADLITKIQAAEKGKQLDIITRKLKATFALPAELVKDKSVEEIITLAKQEATKGYDKTTQDLQAEITAANTKLKEYEEVTIPGVRAEIDKHKKGFNIEQKLTKFLVEQKLRVPMDAAFPAIQNFLNSNYDVDIDDKGEIQVLVKGTKLAPTKADKTGLLTINDIVTEQLDKFQFIEKSKGDPDPKKKEIDPIVPKEGEKKAFVPPHLEAAQKHAADVKAEIEANKAK